MHVRKKFPGNKLLSAKVRRRALSLIEVLVAMALTVTCLVPILQVNLSLLNYHNKFETRLTHELNADKAFAEFVIDLYSGNISTATLNEETLQRGEFLFCFGGKNKQSNDKSKTAQLLQVTVKNSQAPFDEQQYHWVIFRAS